MKGVLIILTSDSGFKTEVVPGGTKRRIVSVLMGLVFYK